MKKLKALALASSCVALLSACGGSDNHDEAPPATPVTSVTVIGDSLADIGTFGVRYTVQSTSGVPYPLWTDLVTAQTEAPQACSYYLSSDGLSFNERAGCSNYAVAGGRIQAPSATLPTSILLQMQAARRVAGDAGFGAQELLLLDGGGNDAADLIEAYIALQASALLQPTPDLDSYAAFLQTVLGEETTQALLKSGEHGPELAAQAYMQALAKHFVAAIQTQLLDGGSPRVAILNIPDVTLTPRFQPLLQILSALAGPDAGPEFAAQVQKLFQGWVTAFNQELAVSFESSTNVVVVDAFAQLGMWAASGAQFGFSNARDAVCPPENPLAIMPSYDIRQCTDTYLDTHAPSDSAADWWKSYAFADGFHPTPLGHAAIAKAVTEAMQSKGWQ